jgi:hypothetical protein
MVPASVLEECRQRPECHQLNLQAFLLEPIQRLPRFKLLLQGAFRASFTAFLLPPLWCVAAARLTAEPLPAADYLKYTDETHPDFVPAQRAFLLWSSSGRSACTAVTLLGPLPLPENAQRRWRRSWKRRAM